MKICVRYCACAVNYDLFKIKLQIFFEKKNLEKIVENVDLRGNKKRYSYEKVRLEKQIITLYMTK